MSAVSVGDKVAMWPVEGKGWLCIPLEQAIERGFSLDGAQVVEVVPDAN